jgi:hypothetical protein
MGSGTCRSGFPVIHQLYTLPNGRSVTRILGGNEVVPCPAWDGRLLLVVLYVAAYGVLAVGLLWFTSRLLRWYEHRRVPEHRTRRRMPARRAQR